MKQTLGKKWETVSAFTNKNKAVIFAILGNLAVAIAKAYGAHTSGSGALFSESVHSFADTANQALLLVGLILALKKPDDRFNYGYGQNRFLLGLISALGIFFLGAGFTIYHGLHALSLGETPHVDSTSAYIMAFSYIVEGYSFSVALKELRHEGYTFFQAFQSGNPTLLAVLFEDTAALIGLFLASVSMIITAMTGSYVFDAICSILIGIMLGALAIVLISMNWRYLTEHAMPKTLREKVCATLMKTGLIREVVEVRSSLIDVDQYRAKIEIRIDGDAYQKIHDDIASASSLIAASEIPALIGDIIDHIKRALVASVEEISVVKIEIAGNGEHSDRIAKIACC